MRKKLSVLLTLVLLMVFMLPSGAYATDDKGLEKAITTAKSLLGITDEYDSFSYSISMQEDTTSYNLYWSDSKQIHSEINATIDSTGRITNYYSYKPYDGRDSIKIPAISKSDALKASNVFIKKVNPSAYGKVRYIEDNSPMYISSDSYNFYYERVENGVPFPVNTINVSVDNRTGLVRNYHCSWTDGLSFPDTSGIITMDRAQQIFTDKLGLKLVYQLKYENDESTPYLAYTITYSNKYIDAKTGEVTSSGGMYYDRGSEQAKTADTASGAGNYTRLSPAEIEAVENAASLLDKKDAEKKARETLKLDDGYRLESINLYKVWQTKADYAWNMYFIKEENSGEESGYYSASATIDAGTGEITSFYKSMPQDSNAAVIYSKEQAKKLAEDYIKEIQSEKSSQVEYTTWGESEVKPMENEEAPRQYSFTFTRLSNGVYFPGNGFNVTVDTTTGTIIGYSFTWYKGKLPLPNDVITPDKAHSILFDNIGLQLQYIADYSKQAEDKVIMPNPGSNKPSIKLVYMLKQSKPSNIDAITGKMLDYSGKPYVENTIADYSDIAGNADESAIRTLAQFGISLPGDKFNPGQVISQREFLFMLAKSMGWYADYEETNEFDNNLYNYLKGQDIIEDGEKSPSSAVSKQEASRFIIRALKYGRVAELKSLFSLPFEDSSSVGSDYHGYVAIAYGFGIFDDEGGYFKPSASLTRSDTAKYLYNLLNFGI